MKQLLYLALILSASPLAAQQVVSVQSGKHDGYTRLVLQIDSNVDWQVEERAGMAVISFPAQSLRFDTARIFDRISTERIADVTGELREGGSELQLHLDCKCEVQSFAFEDKYIVVDVYDGPPLDAVVEPKSALLWQPDSLPFIQPPNLPNRFTAFVLSVSPSQPRIFSDPPKPAESTAPPPDVAMLSEPEMPDVVAENMAGLPSAEHGPEGSVVSDMETMVGAAVSDMNETVEVEDSPEMRARIEEAQAQLLAQLTRAADQGLVDFVSAPVEVVEVVPEPEPVVVPDPAPVDPALMQQLSARTAYSQGTEDALTEIVNQFAMPQCLNDMVFSMEGWGGVGSFSTELAMLRSGLLGEFDTPDAKIAESIVRLYLRYGLGAEARLVLRETGVEFEFGNLYHDMANLLDQDIDRVSGPVLKGAGCGGAHEMWYLAAGMGDYQVLEPLTITDIFSSYPIEVRTLIGPALAQGFIHRGQVEAGHLVLEIVRRAESGVTTAQRMAEAQVMEAQGNIEGAAQVYRGIALGNGEHAPSALIAYARTLLSTESTLPETLLVDLEAAAFFNRNTEIADPLRIWEIKVRSKVAGAKDALMQISEMLDERPELSASLREIAADIFVESRAEIMGDYPYAQMVMRFSSLLAHGPSGDEARLKIAQEMASIGLPETALDLLSPNLERATEAAILIEAAAYVQLFQPTQALEVLDGNNGLAAYKIRLNAYLQLEDFAAVARLLSEDHAQEISLIDVALRAGDWAKIQDAGAVGTLASYIQGGVVSVQPDETLPEMIADEDPSLKAARELLASNEVSMEFLEEVLASRE